MAFPTSTRPNGFLVSGSNPQLSTALASDLDEKDGIPSSLRRKYLEQQKEPSPTPTRKRVVFSSENLRYNKMMLKQARERHRISGGSSRSQSKSRGSCWQNQAIAEHDDKSLSRDRVHHQRPPRSPAPVSFELGTSVGSRGGLTNFRPEVRTGIHQHQESHENERHLTNRKHTLEAPPEIFTSPKRRLLGHGSRSPSPNVSRRHYEHTALDNSEDELGQIDELGEPSHTPATGLSPTGKSPVRRQFHSPQRQRSSTSSRLAVATGAAGKKVTFFPHDSNGHSNSRFSTLVAKTIHGTPPSQTRVPKKRRALSVWRLASPPKVDTGGAAPEAVVVDSESDDANDQNDGKEGSEDDGHDRDTISRESGKGPEVKVVHENPGEQSLTVTETAAPMPMIPGEALQRRTERRSAAKHIGRAAAPQSQQEPETKTVDNAATDSANANQPREKNPIIMCGERHYSEWTGTWDGEARKIFPEGYGPSVGDPETWICPIRDCQTVFSEAWALGGHFSASHRALLLNDNRDGTMSILGKRKFPDPTSGRMPALVISRQPLDPATAPPKAPPRKPGRRNKVENRVPLSDVTPERPKATPVAVPKLLDIPRPRSNSILVIDLPSNRSSKHLYSPDKHSQALLRPKQQADTREKKDYIPDPSSSDESIAHTPIRRSTEGGDIPVSLRAARAQRQDLSSSSKTVNDAHITPANSTRRCRRLTRPEPLPGPKQHRQQQPAPKRPSQVNKSESKKPSRKPSSSSATKLARPSSYSVGESPRRSEGVSAPSPYTMSDWEIAPGRILAGSGDRSDNIAFSSTYLAHSSTSPLHLTPVISFQLLTIQPGTTVHWWAPSSRDNAEDEEPKTRICSVAQGIAKVKLCGQEFPVGPNGLFKVSTGQKCELSSVWYGELWCTSHV